MPQSSNTIAHALSKQPTFDAGTPKELFVLRIQAVGLPGPRNYYAASKDGQRFLVVKVPGDPTVSPTAVVLNWPADLNP